MTLYVDAIEAIWIIVNAAGVFVTTSSLVEALRSWRYARRLNGKHEARRLVAIANVRREGLRDVIQLLLLSLVMPGLFLDFPTPVNPFTVALVAVSAILLAQTLLDTRIRFQLNSLLEKLPPTERGDYALEATVLEVKELTTDVGVKAEAAYKEANTVNEKIARLTELVAGKEDKPDGAET